MKVGWLAEGWLPSQLSEPSPALDKKGKVGWLAVFSSLLLTAPFVCFHGYSSQPTNLHGQINCTGMDLKVGRDRQPTDNSHPSVAL
jgi:hypothetical protein